MDKWAEYKKALQIDKFDLDTALEQQVVIYQDVCEELSVAVSKRDLLEYDKSQLYAEIELRIRDNYEQQGAKITEAKIKALIAVDELYILSVEAVLGAKMDVAEWQNLEAAYKQRAHVLRDLVSLFVSGYAMANIGKASPLASEAFDKAVDNRRGG